MTPVDAERLSRVLDTFPTRTVAVLGDLIGDEYVYTKPGRISREAPVLILRYQGREVRLGGAGNACLNLHGLGARVLPLGVVGADRAGDQIRRLLADRGIATGAVVVAPDRPTPVKTRILAGGYRATRQQVVRVDHEPEGPISPASEAALLERLAGWAGEIDAVILSDYGYGTITGRLLGEVRAIQARGGVVSADSRYDLLRFEGCTAATPNESEVEALLGTPLNGDKGVEEAGWRLLGRLGTRYLLVTRGSRGLALFERSGPATFVPIFGSDEIADVTGAGDTVISTFTLALASGAQAADAARLSNYAGGVVVMKQGTAAISRGELAGALARDAAGPDHGDGPEPR